MIKAIICDMDGTLLNNASQLSEKTIKMMKQFQAKGIRLILASGRNYLSMVPFARELAMDQYDGYLVEINGLAIMSMKSMERLKQQEISLEAIQTMMDEAKIADVEMMAVLDDTIYSYVPENCKEMKKVFKAENGITDDVWTASVFHFVHDQRKNYPHIINVETKADFKESCNKLTFAHEEEILTPFYLNLCEKYQDRFEINRTSYRWMEVMPKNVSKANALMKILDQLGICDDEVLVFGDGENDLPMLERFKYSIAMDNAMDSIKVVVYDTCKSNEEDGVVDYVEKYLEGALV